MKNPDHKIPSYDGARFMWTGNCGACDASDLGIPPGKMPGERVWNDACDVGFWVQGRGRTILFTQDGTRSRNEAPGPENRWDFVSADGFRVIIYND